MELAGLPSASTVAYITLEKTSDAVGKQQQHLGSRKVV